MTTKSVNISAKLENMVQLVSEDDVKKEYGESFASIMGNPAVSWAKFILTDDLKNGNGERIPQTEFMNIINTGIHMPVKMYLGEISPGHPNTKPLGTITHLKEIKTDSGSSAIVALAALWSKERPSDVALLKEKFANNESIDISWEVLYEDGVYNPALDSIDLMGVVLSAATIVGNPAYGGRTPFLAIASKMGDNNESPENNLEEELKTLEQTQAELEQKAAELEQLQAALAEKNTALAAKEGELADLSNKVTEMEAELTSLREFKATEDAKTAKASKLEEIKTKFSEAEIEKDDEFFAANAEKLIAMSDENLDFMITEFKAFAENSKTQSESVAEKKTKKIPAMTGAEGDDLKSPKDIAQALRNSKKKK